MGLDMGLYKKKKTQQGWHEEYEELCYWRKANQIREWFVEHLDDTVGNCKYSIVTEDDLQHLLQDIDKVLSDPGLAPLIIPTSSGFCFGSVEYDDWYFNDLKETKKYITKILVETDWEEEDVAYWEWW